MCFTFLGDKNSHSKTPKFVIIYSIHEVKWPIHIIHQQHCNITTQGKIMIKYVTQWTSHLKSSDLTYCNPVTTFGFSHSSSCILCFSVAWSVIPVIWTLKKTGTGGLWIPGCIRKLNQTHSKQVHGVLRHRALGQNTCFGPKYAKWVCVLYGPIYPLF